MDSWITRINCEISILPKAIYRFNVIPIKIPMAFFFSQKWKKNYLKICLELQKFLNTQSNPEKEQSITCSDFKIYYKAIIIKTVYSTGIKRGTRSVEQIQSPNTHSYTVN